MAIPIATLWENFGTLAIVCFALGGLAFVSAVIVFFVFRIPAVIGILTGKTAGKQIANIWNEARSVDRNSGRFEYFRHMEESGNTTSGKLRRTSGRMDNAHRTGDTDDLWQLRTGNDAGMARPAGNPHANAGVSSGANPVFNSAVNVGTYNPPGEAVFDNITTETELLPNAARGETVYAQGAGSPETELLPNMGESGAGYVQGTGAPETELLPNMGESGAGYAQGTGAPETELLPVGGYTSAEFPGHVAGTPETELLPNMGGNRAVVYTQDAGAPETELLPVGGYTSAELPGHVGGTPETELLPNMGGNRAVVYTQDAGAPETALLADDPAIAGANTGFRLIRDEVVTHD